MSAATQAPAQVRRAVRAFLDEGPRLAQLVTVDHTGTPVTRTVGAHVEPDWTVELVARAGHARLRQLAANPNLQLLFVAEAADPDPVPRPAVIDYGLPAPRVVALTGRAEPMTVADTVACYRRQTLRARQRGNLRAPARADGQVAAELAGVRVRIRRVRAEGFGGDALTATWEPDRSIDPRSDA